MTHDRMNDHVTLKTVLKILFWLPEINDFLKYIQIKYGLFKLL